MSIQEITYNGRRIVVNTESGEPQVTIDGEHIPVWHEKASDEYIATQHSPHISHPSLIDLAKHVTDHVINLRRD